MWKKIIDHSLYWSREHNSGSVTLTLDDGTEGKIRHLPKIELVAFSELFRNEKHIWYHSTRGDITTEKKPADEEDRE